MSKKRVLIVDDSLLIRHMLSDWIGSEPDLEVVGQAHDGEQGVSMAKALRPDLVTLDVEMPKLDGIAALERIMAECPTRVLMVSSVTTEGAERTLRALELGAVDFITKPGGSSSLQMVKVREAVLAKVRAVAGSAIRAPRPALRPRLVASPSSDKIVLVASSTGGPRTLCTLFESLPAGFATPMLLVQHMPAGFTASLAKRLDGVGPMRCREARTGDRPEPGLALFAPGGQHVQVEADGRLKLTEDPPIHGVRPAADILFLSAAKVFGRRLVGAVLTGMGHDGAKGALAVRQAGGVVFGENEASCVIYGMSRSAMLAGGVDRELPIEALAGALVEACSGGLRRAG